MSDMWLLPLTSCFSASSAFCLNPWVMKNAVEPATAPNASIEFIFNAFHTMKSSRMETTAKNHAPCRAINFSPGSPKCLSSRKSQ